MSTGVDVVEVLPGATSGCFCTTPPCTWWMGVVAYSAYGANFTIMVQSGTSPVNLNDGVAQGGGVGPQRSDADACGQTGQRAHPGPLGRRRCRGCWRCGSGRRRSVVSRCGRFVRRGALHSRRFVSAQTLGVGIGRRQAQAERGNSHRNRKQQLFHSICLQKNKASAQG